MDLKLSHIATIEVMNCQPRIDKKTGQQEKSREGKPIFTVEFTQIETKKYENGVTAELRVPGELKSEIEIKPGLCQVELLQFAMTDENSRKVNLHYRIIALAAVTPAAVKKAA